MRLILLSILLSGIFCPIVLSSEYNIHNQFNPLNYIVTDTSQSQRRLYTSNIVSSLYYYKKGELLDNQCSFLSEPQYYKSTHRYNFLKLYYSIIQSHGLNLSVRAIAGHAKGINLLPSDYIRLTNNIVDKYCSSNLTLYSHKSLKNLFYTHYHKGDGLNILDNVFSNNLPKNAKRFLKGSNDKHKDKLNLNIELFRNFCSWSGDPDYPELLSFHANDLNFIAHIIDSFDHKGKEDYSNIVCKNSICRYSDRKSFERSFPFLLGSSSIKTDLKKSFCHELRYPKKLTKNDMKKKWIRSTTSDHENLYKGALFELITNVNDHIFELKSFKSLKEITSSNITESLNIWANKSLKRNSSQSFFEENIELSNITKVNTDKFNDMDLHVDIKVSMGDLDNILDIQDKISLKLDISIDKELLKHTRKNLDGLSLDSAITQIKRTLSLRGVIEDQLSSKIGQYNLNFWNDNLVGLIQNQLIQQLVSYRGKDFWKQNSRRVEIPIRFHFGLFALKYLYYNSNSADISLTNR